MTAPYSFFECCSLGTHTERFLYFGAWRKCQAVWERLPLANGQAGWLPVGFLHRWMGRNNLIIQLLENFQMLVDQLGLILITKSHIGLFVCTVLQPLLWPVCGSCNTLCGHYASITGSLVLTLFEQTRLTPCWFRTALNTTNPPHQCANWSV